MPALWRNVCVCACPSPDLRHIRIAFPKYAYCYPLEECVSLPLPVLQKYPYSLPKYPYGRPREERLPLPLPVPQK